MVDEICHEFFAGEGARMRWPDRKMLRQLAGGTGLKGRIRCERATVVMGHHKGSRGSAHLPSGGLPTHA